MEIPQQQQHQQQQLDQEISVWSRLHEVDADDAQRDSSSSSGAQCNYDSGLENKTGQQLTARYCRLRKRRRKATIHMLAATNNDHEDPTPNNHINNMIPFTSATTTTAATTDSSSARRVSTRYSFFTITLLSIVAISLVHHLSYPYKVVDCLDSPVKIQRSKQPLPIGKHTISDNNNSSNIVTFDSRQNLDDLQPESSYIDATDSRIGSSVGDDLSEHRTIRSKRTNDAASARSRRPNLTECPSQKLMRSLLPPEYVGSPATQGGKSRGCCECTPKSGVRSGWSITCLKRGRDEVCGEASQELNHPPGVHPDLADQMRQHKQSRVANRRVNRSPTRWMGDSPLMSGISNSHRTTEQPKSSMTAEPDAHNGFDDENNAQTMPKSGSGGSSSRSRTMSNNVGSSNQATSAASSSDSMISSSSSDSYSASMQGDYYNNSNNNNYNRNHSSEDKETFPSRAETILSYDVVPKLFDIEYVTGSYIIINCDKATPNYKAAMFQDFNVNDASEFRFLNCKLPNIPFSALLHRTKPQAASSSSSSSGSPAAFNGFQSLRPNAGQRTRPQNHPLARRSAIDDNSDNDDGESAGDEMGGSSSKALAAASATPVESVQPRPPQRKRDHVASLSSQPDNSQRNNRRRVANSIEPSVSKLIIGAENVVVDQRTLMKLLTGLDQLVLLDLRHIQLNLTSILENQQSTTPRAGPASFDLQSDQSSSITTASAAEQANVVPRPSPSSDSSSPGSRTQPPSSDRRTTVQSSAGHPHNHSTGSTTTTPSSTTTTTTSTTTTTTTTTPPPTTQMLSASSSIVSSSTSNKTNVPVPTTATMSSPTAAAAAALTTTTTTSKPAPQTINTQSRRQPVSLLRPAMTTATRPSISLGAPRGLIIAQATGVPPTTTTTMSSTSTSTTTSTTPSPPITTTVVPSITLATVAQQVKPVSRHQLQHQQQTTNSFQQRGSQMATTNAGNNIISVGPAVQSVSYMATNTPAQPTTTTTTNTRSQQFNTQQPGTTSSLMVQTNNNIGLQTNRLHNSPSAWFTSTSSQQHQPQTTTATTNNNQQQQQQPPSAGSRLSGMNIIGAEQSASSSNQATTPWTTSSTASLGGGLSAPINTPGAFGSRTNTNSLFIQPQTTNGNGGQFTASPLSPTRQQTNNLDVGLRSLNSISMLPTTTMTTSSSSSSSSRVQTSGDNPTTAFVAAGGRLSTAVNQPRRRPQNNNNNNHIPTSATSGFINSDEFINVFSSSGSGSGAALTDFGASATNALPDESAPLSESARARFKRSTPLSSSSSSPTTTATAGLLEELEFSFGEILPNLIQLQLDGFLILSQLRRINDQPSSRRSAAPAPVTGRGGLSRPKRQFHPDDMPERVDDHHSDDQMDMLVAEESSVDHESSSSSSNAAVVPPPNTGSEDNVSSAASNSEQQLSLAETKMRQILGKLFSKLAHLDQLALSGNDIPVWPESVLHDSRKTLKRLYLNGNNISRLNGKSFSNMSSLEVVDLSNNNLRRLDSELFPRDTKNLYNVRIKGNKLQSLPLQLLLLQTKGNTTNMPTLDFGLNKDLKKLVVATDYLTRQQPLPVSSVRVLNFSDCSLDDQIDPQTGVSAFKLLFMSAPQMIKLSLNGNKLRNLLSIEDLFADNNQLEELDLSANSISKLDANLFGPNASRIANLRLDNNQITEIPSGFLDRLTKLKRISFAHNKLASLPAGLFYKHDMIETIDLSHNLLIQLKSSEGDIFRLNLQPDESSDSGFSPSLKVLNLAHNNLSGFEEEISHYNWINFVALESLNLANNKFRGRIRMLSFVRSVTINMNRNLIEGVDVDDQLANMQLYHEDQTTTPNIIEVSLAGNPIVCDCLLEPMISYSNQVAYFLNPTSGRRQKESEANTRYGVLGNDLSGNNNNNNKRPQDIKPQEVYKFNLDEMQCAGPVDGNMRGQKLTYVERKDLYCPLAANERLCPKECSCLYQSISRTIIVDCNNRSLTEIPNQLTNLTNFAQVDLNSFLTPSQRADSHVGHSKKLIDINLVTLRLQNNKLRSMEPLDKLFEYINVTADQVNSRRYTRLALPAASNEPESMSDIESSTARDLPVASAQPQAQPLVAELPTKKAIASPVVIGRGMHGNGPLRQRSRRETTTTTTTMAAADNNGDSDEMDASPGAANIHNDHIPLSINNDASSLEEGADLSRSKRPVGQPISCEIYLDNNFIETIPDSFLEFLNHYDSSSIVPNQVSPHLQTAQPSHLQDKPNRYKIDPGSIDYPDKESLTASGPNDMGPFKEERIRAPRETINSNQQQQQQQQQQQIVVSPSLLILSLKRNKLTTLQTKILDRFDKLIRSSHTKLSLGHNPYNCSEDLSIPESISSLDDHTGALESTALAPSNCPAFQYKAWVDNHLDNIDDVQEIYCVSMPEELRTQLGLTGYFSGLPITTPKNFASRRPPVYPMSPYNHANPEMHSDSSTNITKDDFQWDSSLHMAKARLTAIDRWDLCPLSRPVTASPGQQIILSVAIVFMLISILLLMMLFYFGDTQTILAFTYIHLNPIYKCLRLNESHLDGDKLYDAFVSFTDADLDIVEQLVERLERQPLHQQQQPTIGTLNRRSKLPANENNNSDRGAQEALVSGELNRRPDGLVASDRRSQETLNRSSSRITIGDDDQSNGKQYSGSANDITGNRPYRLCIHTRDWLPGHLISWNIVNSVQNSRRTIMILSKDFIKSTWFQVEFKTAYYQMIEDKIDRLIVIVRGELPPKHELDKNLAFLLTTKTYLKWGDKWFWERLHYALPHRTNPAAMSKVAAKKQQQHHHHRYPPTPKTTESVSVVSNGWISSKSSSSDLMSPSATNGHNLIMSNIGKDCSNLLLPVHHNNTSSLLRNPQDSAPILNNISSSSSSSQSSQHTRTSGASSFFSGSPMSSNNTTVTTTSNDLLSASPEKTSTTRLTISNNNQSAALTDSGRVTATLSSSSSLLTGRPSTPVGYGGGGGGVTNIMLDGQQANSWAKRKRQDKMHDFVKKTIDESREKFNLSEL